MTAKTTAIAASTAALVLFAASAGSAAAQSPAAPRAERLSPAAAAPAMAADVPLQCWWRASSGAIRVGEVVDVSLTCAVLDSAATTVVPDESRLTVAAVQLSPFEIVDGSHPPDVVDGDRRFFQYRYRLRLINPDVIGRDVKLPPLAIGYRVQSRLGADATLAGRDLVHQLPSLVFRVVSQVPADADDIRDSGDASLAEIEALRFRASAFGLAAMVLTVLGAVAAVSLLAPAFGWWRRARPAAPRRLSDRQVLGRAARVLDERLAAARGAGWTAQGLAEAHRAARIVAAVAAGAGVRERPLDRAADVSEGHLAVGGPFGRHAAALTTDVTTAHLTRALAALAPDASAALRTRLERLRDALAALTRVQYGVADAIDGAAVDAAVSTVRDIGVALAREQLTSPRAWLARPAPAALTAPEF